MNVRNKEVTIYDIAKKLNISAATVSRSLTDYAGTNVKTKKRVLTAAKDMGYIVNTNASSLRSKKSRVIGVIVPRFNSNFIAEVIAGIEIVVNKANYTLVVSQSLESITNEKKCAEVMSSNRVTGLLVSLASNSNCIAHFNELIHKDIPVIFFDRIFKLENVPCVHIDNYHAAYQVTTHLIEQGCKNIMHVTANQISNVYLDRYRGYRRALANYQLPFTEDMLLINNLSAQDGIDVAKLVANLFTRPDAIFFANDTCAINCMIELKKNGIDIPQEIAIAGFNNDPITCLVEPNLTTVSYKGFEMGKVAANLLVDYISHKNVWGSTESLILKSELIIRGSSLRSNKINDLTNSSKDLKYTEE